MSLDAVSAAPACVLLAILGYFCSAGDIKARRDSSRTKLSYPAQKVRKMRLHPPRVATWFLLLSSHSAALAPPARLDKKIVAHTQDIAFDFCVRARSSPPGRRPKILFVNSIKLCGRISHKIISPEKLRHWIYPSLFMYVSCCAGRCNKGRPVIWKRVELASVIIWQELSYIS